MRGEKTSDLMAFGVFTAYSIWIELGVPTSGNEVEEEDGRDDVADRAVQKCTAQANQRREA